MGLGAVGADRLALALADAKPADELRADQEADEQRGCRRCSGAKGDVAEEVENPRIMELFGDPEKHQPFLLARASTRVERPTLFDPLTRIASPGPSASRASSSAEAASATCAILTFGPSAFASGAISAPTRIA